MILLGLLATVALAIAAAYLRAAGKRFEPPLTPSALAAVGGHVPPCSWPTARSRSRVSTRPPRWKSGLPLALVVLGGDRPVACRAAMREEEQGTAWREEPVETATTS